MSIRGTLRIVNPQKDSEYESLATEPASVENLLYSARYDAANINDVKNIMRDEIVYKYCFPQVLVDAR